MYFENYGCNQSNQTSFLDAPLPALPRLFMSAGVEPSLENGGPRLFIWAGGLPSLKIQRKRWDDCGERVNEIAICEGKRESLVVK